MSWYGKRVQKEVGNVLFLAALNPVWTSERTNCEIKYCDVDNIRKAVSENTDIALVFMTEGMFQTKGVFRFEYEFSDRTPLHLSNEAAFLINVYISQYTKTEQYTLNQMLHGENGRQTFLSLVKLVFKGDDGLKVESDKPPTIKGPGDNIVLLPQSKADVEWANLK